MFQMVVLGLPMMRQQKKCLMSEPVVLVKGNSRGDNIKKALSMLDISLKGKSNVFIKPNIVSHLHPNASTHPVALEAVLGFIREIYKGKITIGECASYPTVIGYRKFGYIDIAKRYGAELVDLNQGSWVEFEAYGLPLHYSKLVAESDYRISLCLPKTHDAVRVSLSVKNLAMGSLKGDIPKGLYGTLRFLYEKIPAFIRYSGPVNILKRVMVFRDDDRTRVHKDRWMHNQIIKMLHERFPVHLSVIDGYTGMEGDGPIIGKKVMWGIAIASQDAVAADSLAAYLMGFNPMEIGYLYFPGCADIKAMNIVGEKPEDCRRTFERSPTDEKQRLVDGK